ncbi:stress protein [Paenibacillus sp. FSL R7-0273]|uniref:Dabb family protein n=1 Tax=Paenibacillus sp. FSL R7-0273 TaxID=1536772 RepID=UPI0004F5CDDC|nr:Dabb family protein [Paenibacillus sp. FSL R7-0273]AIQ46663.1 stress protein [Paenibacillus sp. FSL R7-0273]OMF97569.1 stress protein [Paenibacillus sp. FSL R7-0273]
MYEHLVVFKFNSSFDPQQEQQLVKTLLGLKDQIPGISGLTAGVNVTGETENVHGYTLGLRVTFTDQEALRAYGPHPAHQNFVAMLEGIIESVVVVDYPVPAD